MTNLVGQTIGQYRILERLGEGGMATVYKAFDTRLEREVAIKFMRWGRLGVEGSEITVKRFKREARVLARLAHPNILTLLDYGEHEGQLYLVTNYVPNGSLKDRPGGPMPWREAVRLLAPIARALEYAHRQGVLHRDVKPSNILLSPSGLPILADFGIAKIAGGDGPAGQGQSTLTDLSQLTRTEVSIGTPEYMAPEQGRGLVDPRSDIYSLGVVFYELVTGRRPFIADTPLAVMVMHASDPVTPPHKYVPGLPAGVEQVILRALEKNPGDRFRDMGEFARKLDGLIAGRKAGRTTASDPAQAAGPTADHQPELIRRGAIALGILALLVVGYVYGRGPLGAALSSATATPTATSTRTPTPTLTFMPTPLLYRLLETGAFVKGQPPICDNCTTLKVTNGDQDAVVVLEGTCSSAAGPGVTAVPGSFLPTASTVNCVPVLTSATVAVYIRAHETYTFKGVTGSLRLCFTQGEDWDDGLNRFTREGSFACIKDPVYLSPFPIPSLKVTGKRVVMSYLMASFSVTLYPVAGATTEIVPLAPYLFPALGD